MPGKVQRGDEGVGRRRILRGDAIELAGVEGRRELLGERAPTSTPAPTRPPVTDR